MLDQETKRKIYTVVDPACGTAGFLISSYNHIIESEEFARLAAHPIKDDFRSLTNDWRQIIPE
jgi:type I restriction-modification system DNA methylase subunit